VVSLAATGPFSTIHQHPEEGMETGGVGQVLALVGLVFLLLTGLGRQRARRQQQKPSPAFQRWQQWGSYTAFALILIGLVLMATAK